MSELPVVAGFRFAGIHAGIKPQGLDLALIAADDPYPAAAMFTRNRVRAAPVELAQERVRAGKVQAILVNSGNANACTGRPGVMAACRLTERVASELGIEPTKVLPASTGVIGMQLPTDTVITAVPALVRELRPDRASEFSRAILTTDRGPKTATARVKLGRLRGTILGMAKGAGMIHPDMATTLGFVVTDVAVTRPFLKRALRAAVDETFNRITVDGDTSTNDAIFVVASGKVGNSALRDARGSGARFVTALTDVLASLGKQIVADGEGAERLVRVDVQGASDDRAAVRMAKTVATSLLVKTAIHGADPNYGRILGALGRSGVLFDVDKVEIRIGDVVVFKRGLPVGPISEEPAGRVMQQAEYTLGIRLAEGRGRGHCYTCDLGHSYVKINADYRS